MTLGNAIATIHSYLCVLPECFRNRGNCCQKIQVIRKILFHLRLKAMDVSLLRNADFYLKTVSAFCIHKRVTL
ncbi:hypothetical protein KsCSTR_11430 [Candidatus Kuenenia stuttgartiensis]|uniref:Uncharacterized protein n=1 Tax=Kuenenia stuttgartiensis TaxID=174633 RepID=Q1PYG7_KUEST|nr:hypothetical protein KsCSTR_11430 [Candidatus Kuenenia stuttgartiensis]CAJ72121.1 unknown protein [Candidatus Kuenenia stuttgartiensis]